MLLDGLVLGEIVLIPSSGVIFFVILAFDSSTLGSLSRQEVTRTQKLNEAWLAITICHNYYHCSLHVDSSQARLAIFIISMVANNTYRVTKALTNGVLGKPYGVMLSIANQSKTE